MPYLPRKHTSSGPDQRLLIAAGEALYGPMYQARLAAEIGVTPAWLARVKAGHSNLSQRTRDALIERIEAQLGEVGSLLRSWPKRPAPEAKHALLEAVGRTLFTAMWQMPMAEALAAVAPELFLSEEPGKPRRGRAAPMHRRRKVARWGVGMQPIPAELWPALHRMVLDRRKALVQVMGEMVARKESAAA